MVQRVRLQRTQPRVLRPTSQAQYLPAGEHAMLQAADGACWLTARRLSHSCQSLSRSRARVACRQQVVQRAHAPPRGITRLAAASAGACRVQKSCQTGRWAPHTAEARHSAGHVQTLNASSCTACQSLSAGATAGRGSLTSSWDPRGSTVHASHASFTGVTLAGVISSW